MSSKSEIIPLEKKFLTVPVCNMPISPSISKIKNDKEFIETPEKNEFINLRERD